MMAHKDIIQMYGQALLKNDYSTMIGLFSKDARVYSFFSGEKSPQEFFKNLFSTSRRTHVTLKNMFVDVENRRGVAAYLFIEAIWNETFTLQFEAVDLFTFDSENKITTLKIILEPIRKLNK